MFLKKFSTLFWLIFCSTFFFSVKSSEFSGTFFLGGEVKNNPTLPEFSFQQPTYLLEKEEKKEIYICDPDKSECKVNFNFEDTFEEINASDYFCEIDFWTENETGYEDSCNPATIIFEKGIFFVKIWIRKKETGEIFYKEITIDNSYEKPKIIFQEPYIEIQSGLDEDFMCTSSSCSVNLIYSGDGVDCLWDFWGGIFSTEGTETKCNPGYIQYENFSEENITLTLTDENYPENSHTEIITIFPYKKKSSGGSSQTRYEIPDFDIEIQSGIDENFFCKKDPCTINLITEIDEKNFSCAWDFWDGNFSTEGTENKCNPWYVEFSWDTKYYVNLTIFQENIPSNSEKKTLTFFSKNSENFSENLEPKITLQGKIGADKKILSDTELQCTKIPCSVNFSGEESIWNYESAFWDFWNGQNFSGINPWYIRFEDFWTYKVIFTLKNNFSEEKTSFTIFLTEEEKKEEEEFFFDPFIDKISLEKALINPDGTDVYEWILLKNTHTDPVNISGCILDDSREKGSSKPYIFPENTILLPGEEKKFYKSETKITLNNTNDFLFFSCGDFEQSFSWSFPIPSGYIYGKNTYTEQEVQVIRVIDGDTIKISDIDGNIITIRMLGIDTPETVHPYKEVQYFWKEASDFMKKILTGKTVTLKYDTNIFDKYGRTLGYIWLDDVFVNQLLLEKGFARMEKRFPFMYYEDFLKIEQEAQRKKVGLWQEEKIFEEFEEISLEEIELLEEEIFLEKVEEIQEKIKNISPDTEISQEKIIQDIFWPITEISFSFRDGMMIIFGKSYPNISLKFTIASEIFFLKTDVWGNFSISTGNIPKSSFLYSLEIQGKEVFYPVKTGTKTIPKNFKTLSEIKNLSEEMTIFIQGKIGKNKTLTSTGISCIGAPNCSLNLTVSNEKIPGKYFWNFWDGTFFTGVNPPSKNFPPGIHEITLQLENISGIYERKILFEVYEQIKNTSNTQEKILEKTMKKSEETNKKENYTTILDAMHQQEKTTKTWLLSIFLLGNFWVFVLRKKIS